MYPAPVKIYMTRIESVPRCRGAFFTSTFDIQNLKNRRISNIELRMSKYYVPCTGKNIYNEDRERPGMSGRSFFTSTFDILHSIFCGFLDAVAPAEPPAFRKPQSYAELTAESRREDNSAKLCVVLCETLRLNKHGSQRTKPM
jgi:hypothetical protein